jgi:2-amino-4-hydroxy-6-hydroxymethyldihydropteridine diphosphokinase
MRIVIALGANIPGKWGPPEATLARAIKKLPEYDMRILAASRLYVNRFVGAGCQPDFTNGVLLANSHLPPHALLYRLKQIERLAGRRNKRRWKERSLDLDIIDYNSLILNWHCGADHKRWQDNAVHRPLVLPHPLAHTRRFVMQPLAEILPRWHHPVLGNTATQLLRAKQGPATLPAYADNTLTVRISNHP